MKDISIHSYRTKYEDNAYEGVKYLLQDLDYEEAKVFFEQARLRRSAPFEDDFERQYTLAYNTDGTFTLSRR